MFQRRNDLRLFTEAIRVGQRRGSGGGRARATCHRSAFQELRKANRLDSHSAFQAFIIGRPDSSLPTLPDLLNNHVMFNAITRFHTPLWMYTVACGNPDEYTPR